MSRAAPYRRQVQVALNGRVAAGLEAGETPARTALPPHPMKSLFHFLLVLFCTASRLSAQESIFPNSKTGNNSGPEGNFYELGTIFRSSVAGNVTPKTIHTFLKPPIHHRIYFFTQHWVFPIKIWLLVTKIMQVITVGKCIIPPTTSIYFKRAWPKCRLASFSRPPVKIVSVFIGAAATSLFKPLMFIAAMVYHQIHH